MDTNASDYLNMLLSETEPFLEQLKNQLDYAGTENDV